MKNIKLIVYLLFIILLTGCQREYYLTVDDNKIVENFDVVLTNNDDNNARLSLDYYPIHADNNVIYNKTVTKENGMINAHFEYVYKPQKFVNANSVNQCFEDREIIVDEEKYYYFKLGKFKNCMNDSNIDIIIITDNKVLKNNADKVNDNKYIWYLRDENKENFNLEIKIAKGKKRNKFLVSYIIIGAIVLCVILIFAISLISKNRKSNEV